MKAELEAYVLSSMNDAFTYFYYWKDGLLFVLLILYL